MRRILQAVLFISAVLSGSASRATNFVFTGIGDWNTASNWQDNLMPATTLAAGDSAIITTSAIVGCSSCFTGFGSNSGVIVIQSGASLEFKNATQFSNYGHILVLGSMTSQTTWENYPGSMITVYGTLTIKPAPFLGFTTKGQIIVNNGVINILPGAKLDNEFGTPAGQITLNGGTINNNGTFKPGLLINNGGVVNNTSVVSGNVNFNGNLTNAGTISPGNSPGKIAVTGDYTATSTAVHNFEIQGVTSNLYDIMEVSRNVNLAGTLNVTRIGGFNLTSFHEIPIITGTINGTFSTVNLPSGYVLIYNSNNVTARFLSPLPVTFLNIDVIKNGSGSKILWKVSEEKNVLRYEIEKSPDGNKFTVLGSVNAASTQDYSFNDGNPHYRNFYRIKSIDQDGSFSYSRIVLFSNGKGAIVFKAYPNPFHNDLVIEHPTSSGKDQITVSSIDGKTMQIIKPALRSQQTKMNLSQLPLGMYWVKFESNGEVNMTKIVRY
jgi:hypothetical protein